MLYSFLITGKFANLNYVSEEIKKKKKVDKPEVVQVVDLLC